MSRAGHIAEVFVSIQGEGIFAGVLQRLDAADVASTVILPRRVDGFRVARSGTQVECIIREIRSMVMNSSHSCGPLLWTIPEFTR